MRLYDDCIDLYFCDYTIRLTVYYKSEIWYQVAYGYGGPPAYFSTDFIHSTNYNDDELDIDLTNMKAVEEQMQYFALFV